MPTNQPPFVIHVDDMPNYPDAVYIGRQNPRRKMKRSPWANPYKVEHYGRTLAIARYASDVSRDFEYARLNDLTPVPNLADLTGKPLACWCRHHGEGRTEENTCHGDILTELWRECIGKD